MAFSPLSPAVTDGLVHDTSALVVDGPGLAAALDAHRTLLTGPHADLIGGFAVAAGHAEELRILADPQAVLVVSLVADDGLMALQEARHAIQDDTWIELDHVAIDLPGGFSAGAATGALLEELAFTVPTYVGVPRTGFDTALDVLAADGAERAAYRCGGGEGVPTDGELASFVHGCVDRRVGFRISDGLDHAVRGDGSDPHHGVLNVLAATAAALGGASTDELVELLATGQATTLLEVVAGAAPRDLRAAFSGFGTSDVSGTVARLAEASAL